jgi:hypothetical protein
MVEMRRCSSSMKVRTILSSPDITDDRHLLREASSAHLQRLRKQELARLWRVAGLDTADTSEGDDNDELRKSELVEGIIKAVSHCRRETSLTFTSGDPQLLMYD